MFSRGDGGRREPPAEGPHFPQRFFSRGAPWRGQMGSGRGASASGVTRRARRGPWRARCLPQGSPRRCARLRAHLDDGAGGWGSPRGDSLWGGGASARGAPRGDTKAGEARHARCVPRPWGGAGVTRMKTGRRARRVRGEARAWSARGSRVRCTRRDRPASPPVSIPARCARARRVSYL